MITKLQKEIQKLENQLLNISGQAEKNLKRAMLALESCDQNLAKQIIKSDKQLDILEVELEENCLKVLALFQPVAIDLRFIVAILKINNDLERVGDLAADIAQETLTIKSTNNQQLLQFNLPQMADYAWTMVHNSLDSLVNMDGQKAINIRLQDQKIDDMHKKNMVLIEKFAKQPSPNIAQAISYLAVSRHLERIADHATNIAEDVIYMLAGDIVRHQQIN